MIYLDYAATSYNKPEKVKKAVLESLDSANPGRSGHPLAAKAARTVFRARESLADFFGAASSDRVIFTKNATEALNMILQGLLSGGGRVVTSAFEHNSVMRPLMTLAQKKGLEIDYYRTLPDGSLDIEGLEKTVGKDTRLIVSTHASNVTGEIFPVEELAEFARDKNLPLGVDAAQSAGILDLDVEKTGVSYLAFTGHKHLFGPQGTGGLALGRNAALPPLLQGGTGSRSESTVQPDFTPDGLESGTVNTPGIAGLGAGVEYLAEKGLPGLREKEKYLRKRLVAGLLEIEGLTIHGPMEKNRTTGNVSFTVKGADVGEIARSLASDYGVMTRHGLHCAPAAHESLGTFPDGTVRMSLSWVNTEEEIDEAVEAVEKTCAALRA